MSKKKNKKILYYSTDKLYKIKNRKISKRGILILSILSTLILFVSAAICFKYSVVIKDDSVVKYNEKGNVDYKVYLKDNDYYDTSYLNSGMQYVANLIKTINVKFNYEIDTTKDVSFNNKYNVVGELQITEKGDPTKVLFRKKEELIKEKNVNITDDKFVIDEEVDIDYNKYNNIVNSYKKDLGLTVSSNLILTLQINTDGVYEKDKLTKGNNLQITIPLSESTINITMNSNEINNNGLLSEDDKQFKVDNVYLFIASLFLLVITIFNVIFDVYVYMKKFKKDVYKNKVSKILRDYDRLIITGKVSIDEKQYANKVYPETFEEMVDVAQNLNVPIMYYELIPDEKCFFVIAKDNTLYKYRLTKAFLEKNPNNKVENDYNQADI